MAAAWEILPVHPTHGTTEQMLARPWFARWTVSAPYPTNWRTIIRTFDNEADLVAAIQAPMGSAYYVHGYKWDEKPRADPYNRDHAPRIQYDLVAGRVNPNYKGRNPYGLKKGITLLPKKDA